MKRPLNQFRWAAGAVLTLLLCSLLMLSCQDENARSSDPQDENKSEISLIEEQIGASLYKRELTISDESGENKVTIRVAGRDEAMLAEYLKARAFSIKPVYKHEKKETIKLPSQQDSQPVFADPDEGYESTVIIEFVSQELKEGVIGIGFRDQPNPSYKIDNSGRTKYYNYSNHVSNNWPSILAFQAYAQVEFMLWFKGRWYQSWTPWFGPATWCCYDYTDFDVDGPYRVSLRIQYDYVGDYYYEWFY